MKGNQGEAKGIHQAVLLRVGAKSIVLIVLHFIVVSHVVSPTWLTTMSRFVGCCEGFRRRREEPYRRVPTGPAGRSGE